MKKLLIGSMMVGLWGVFSVSQVHAISIDFSPQNQNANVSDAVSVDIIVSGLESGGLDEIVSSFDLDITYDASIVSFTSVTFGPELGFSFQSDSNLPGLIDFAEISLESDAFLQATQGDSVNLGTLSFNAISLGTTSLDFVFDPFNLLTGLNADALRLDSFDAGSITVRDSVVPVPSTLILLGIGILALGRQMRQRH